MGEKLGQHFLRDTKVLDAIVDTADPHADEIILEIGPGKGVLTERLIPFAAKVIAVEKDPKLVDYLQDRFAEAIAEKRLDLVERDIRDFDPEMLCFYTESPQQKEGASSRAVQGSGEERREPYTLVRRSSTADDDAEMSRDRAFDYSIVANIPYYITGRILRQFLTADCQPSQMVLLVQKEVAERIVAKDGKPFDSAQGKPFDSAQGKESILSLSVKVYGTPEYVRTVKAGAFSPPPEVDSAILSIRDISRDFFKENDIDERVFFRLIKAGFRHKRKQLANNLSELYEKTAVQKALEKIGRADSVRAEDLTLVEWKQFIKEME